MSKNLELSGFNGRSLPNGEKIQPNVSGLGEHVTQEGTSVTRSESSPTVLLTSISDRTYLGALACLNLIYNRVIPSFPNSDRSSFSRNVVVYPDTRGTVGDTFQPFPITYNYKEWKIIVDLSREYEESPYIRSVVSRKEYQKAISHLEVQIAEKYLEAKLIPSSIVEVTKVEEEPVEGLPSPPIVE